MRKRLTTEHKRNISASTKGVKKPRTKDVSYKGQVHHRSKEWALVSPSGDVHRTKDIKSFCETHGLNYSSLRYKGQTKNYLPIRSGPSKGWRVIRYV